jgi:uncharacterized protein (DUF305 family)
VTKESALYGLVGLLAGIIVGLIGANYSASRGITRMANLMEVHHDTQFGSGDYMMPHHSETGMEQSMDAMMAPLSGKFGEEFDEAFVRSMIVHHLGAIEMAERAKISATRNEIKQMSDDIISVQSAEIEIMEKWLKEWGY